MKLYNETPYPAALFRTTLREPDQMYGSLLVRVRHEITTVEEQGPIHRAKRRQWRLDPAPVERQDPELRPEEVQDGAHTLPDEQFFPRTGTDLVVLADAVAPVGGEPATRVDVRVRAGSYDLRLAVFGDRTWQRDGDALRPTAPLPFVRMPVTWERAFGGTTKTEYGDLPFAHNPSGRGFCMSEELAEGLALPNIEDPDDLTASWDQTPDPVGLSFYPANWGLRMQALVEQKDDGAVAVHLDRGLFDRAHPRLCGGKVEPGDTVVLENLGGEPHPAGEPVRFSVPPCPVLAEVLLGERTFTRDLELEEVMVDLRNGTVDLSYRKLFDYRVVPRQPRVTWVRTKEGAER